MAPTTGGACNWDKAMIGMLGARRSNHVGACIIAAAALLACAAPSPVHSSEGDLDAPLEVVVFSEADTLRDLVDRYLHDPDLWPTVLRLNDIASPADLVPGVRLRLPVRQVLAADEALLAALKAIQLATAEGARIFAPAEIGDAIEQRDIAVLHRQGGDWREAVVISDEAAQNATQALEISIQQRDRAAEAIVSDVQGRVEGRAPVEPNWSNRQLNDILVEFERLRTLSASTTQITFRDLSRLRLNPNSNATIQRMRSDPLTGGEVTKVSLANGDFYALLNQLSDKTQFEIDVPGIETTTNSADFWIKNDQSGARFVNYDAPDMQIRKDGQTIVVGENEGVVLTGQGAERAQVLAAPRLSDPAPGTVVYNGTVALGWEAYDGAQGYWLEVARDAGFNQMEISEWGLRETGFEAELPQAHYHWRVAALDALGLPGEWSTAQDFVVRIDVTPPYLAVLAPGDGVVTDAATVEVLGASEAQVRLTLNGAPLALAADGGFLTEVSLRPGPNTIRVIAEDPAGNRTERSQTVVYRPEAQVTITLANDIARVGAALATRTEELSLRGQTNAQPGAPLIVRDVASDAVLLRTEVGPDGAIGFTVPAGESRREMRIEVASPQGRVEGQLGFSVLRDSVPPVLTLDQPPPRATDAPDVMLSGAAGDAVRLTLNGASVPLDGGRFEVTQALAPGPNPLELVAADAVGNLTVRSLVTRLDLDPPEILSVELNRPKGEDGPIEIVARARDDSGLVQAAPFVIAVGGTERTGFLRCDSASGICRASLPPEPGRLELIELSVEDYAGNLAFE